MKNRYIGYKIMKNTAYVSKATQLKSRVTLTKPLLYYGIFDITLRYRNNNTRVPTVLRKKSPEFSLSAYQNFHEIR